MKRAVSLLVLVALLTGCTKTASLMEKGLALRARLLAAAGCSFDADITADYGDKVYTFSMACDGDEKGNLTFRVTQPETIAGITGTISGEGGKLTFVDTALQFSLMADGQLSPVSAPWIFLQTLRSGYITSVGMDEEQLLLNIDDSYDDDALHLDIWLDDEEMPARVEILYDGRRILSLAVTNFQIR